MTPATYPQSVRVWSRNGGHRMGLQLDAQRVVVLWDTGVRVQRLAPGYLKIARVFNDYPAGRARRKLRQAGRRLGMSAGAKQALMERQ